MKPSFEGEIDEVKLGTSLTADATELPRGVRFAGPSRIRFAPGGRLDATMHASPVTITLLYEEDKRRRDVVVGLLGEIR